MTSVSSPPTRPQGDDRSAAQRRKEPHDALPAGTLLGGSYRLERTLGQGGFGIVYLATDVALERPLAIKEYLPVHLAGRGLGASIGLREAGHRDAFLRGLESFLREARLLAQFDHPALVRVYRFWEENHTAYMAMPYCEGPTLAAARQGMLRPPDEAWLRDQLLLPLLGALQTLHAAQCLHRDVAPGNILLKPDGLPMLLDFGSARRVASDMTQPLTAIINPSYAAIEQYAESSTLPQGPWTDLYGLAAVTYFALSGRAPVPATVRAVNEAALMPFAEVAQLTERSFPGLRYSAPFVAAIDAALAVRPGDRPQTVQALREALGRAHVQPDVTIEGPPLQAQAPYPPKPPAAAAAPAPAAAEQEPEDPAVRAAITAALADIADWPPLSARRGAGRIEPSLLSPEPAPEAECVSAAPAQEPATARPPLHATPPSQPTSPPLPAAGAEAPAWMATAPAICARLPATPAAAAPADTSARAGTTAAPATVPAGDAQAAAAAPALPFPQAPAPMAGALPPAPLAVPRAEADEFDLPPLDFAAIRDRSNDGAQTFACAAPARRRGKATWAALAALVAATAAGAWYLQSDDGQRLSLLTGEAQNTPRPVPPPVEVAPRSAAPAPSPASSMVPALAAAPPAASAAPAASVAAASATARLPAAAPALTAPVAAAPASAATGPADAPVTAAQTAAAGTTAAADDSGPTQAASNGANSSGTAAHRPSAKASAQRHTAPEPPAKTAAAAKPPAPETAATTPRSVCGARTNFSLLYCMRTQCQQPRFANHAQCRRLKESDEIPAS